MSIETDIVKRALIQARTNQTGAAELLISEGPLEKRSSGASNESRTKLDVLTLPKISEALADAVRQRIITEVQALDINDQSAVRSRYHDDSIEITVQNGILPRVQKNIVRTNDKDRCAAIV